MPKARHQQGTMCTAACSKHAAGVQEAQQQQQQQQQTARGITDVQQRPDSSWFGARTLCARPQHRPDTAGVVKRSHSL